MANRVDGVVIANLWEKKKKTNRKENVKEKVANHGKSKEGRANRPEKHKSLTVLKNNCNTQIRNCAERAMIATW